MSKSKKVADQVQVSVATVSRIIHNDSVAAKKTKLKVIKAIEHLNYKTTRVAQRLESSKGNNQLIALLVPDIRKNWILSGNSGYKSGLDTQNRLSVDFTYNILTLGYMEGINNRTTRVLIKNV